MTTIQLEICYVSYLYLVVVPICLWLLWRKKSMAGTFSGRVFLLLMIGGLSVLAWARFVEPRILITNQHEIRLCGRGNGELRATVFADTHYGLFQNAMSAERIVAQVNETDPDIILIPGDFTDHLSSADMMNTFKAFGELEAPAFAVMGNHDEGLSGIDVTDELDAVLSEIGVSVIDGEFADIRVNDTTIRLIGTVDHWTVQQRGVPYASSIPANTADMTLMLQHNPDAIWRLSREYEFDLMISGHTHGGQIFLPLVTCKLTFACDTQRYGFKKMRAGNLFVTSGTGMVGLSMRFNVSPVIDVLNIRYSTCGSNE